MKVSLLRTEKCLKRICTLELDEEGSGTVHTRRELKAATAVSHRVSRSDRTSTRGITMAAKCSNLQPRLCDVLARATSVDLLVRYSGGRGMLLTYLNFTGIRRSRLNYQLQSLLHTVKKFSCKIIRRVPLRSLLRLSA